MEIRKVLETCVLCALDALCIVDNISPVLTRLTTKIACKAIKMKH